MSPHLRVIVLPGVSHDRAHGLIAEFLPRLGLEVGSPGEAVDESAAATIVFAPADAPPVPEAGPGPSLIVPLGAGWRDVDSIDSTWLGDVPVLHRRGARPTALVEDGRVAIELLEAMELLLFTEEELVPDRDSRGRFRPEYGILDGLGLAPFAVLERAIDAIAGWLLKRAPALRRRPWPGGAAFLIALTHDVDSVFTDRASLRKASHLLRSGLARRRGTALESGAGEVARALTLRRPSGPFNFASWELLEDTLDVKATYHFFGDYERGRDPDDAWYAYDERGMRRGRVEPLREAIRDMARRGHDIGLHPTIASFDDHARFVRERVSLARAIDADPVSVRCHHLRFDARRSARPFAAAGLRFDTSIGGMGFARGTAFPQRLDRADPGSLVEIPTIAMDHIFVKETRQGLPPALARRRLARLLGEVRDRGGAAAVLFHPDTDDKQALLRWVVEWTRDSGGACVTARELGETWLDRSRAQLERSATGHGPLG